MKSGFLGAVILIGSFASTQSAPDPLLGTWQFISQETRDDAGDVSYPYGRNPNGRLVYDVAGNMFVLLFDPARPRFGAGDRLRGTNEEVKAAFEGAVAY